MTDRRLIIILLVIFVQIVGASMVLPILPLYAKREFGMQPATITLLITVFFAAQFIAGPFIGRLSDKYGRVPVLVVSQIGTVLSFLMLGLAPSVAILFFARVLDGITGGNIIVAQAYITDIAPKEKRTEALGLIFAAFGVGFIIGPAMGGILASTFTYRTPYYVAAIAATIVVGLTWFFLEETNTVEQRDANKKKGTKPLGLGDVITNMPLLSILGISFGAQLAFSMLQSTFALYGEAVIFSSTPARAELGVGILLTFFGVGQIITQGFLIRRLVKRFGDSPLVVIGSIARTASMFGIIIFTSLYLAPISLLLFAFGAGTQMPALQSLVTNTVPDENRGTVLGWYQSSLSLAIIFGSAIAGLLFSVAPQVPYAVGGVIYAITIIPGIFLVNWARRQKLHEQQQDELASGVVAVPAGD